MINKQLELFVFVLALKKLPRSMWLIHESFPSELWDPEYSKTLAVTQGEPNQPEILNPKMCTRKVVTQGNSFRTMTWLH